MLKSLSIRNVVLIDKLDLDFSAGFSVLSGETGAGKSILLDSLGILLGKRADTSMIRSGCDKLSVSGVFLLKNRDNYLRQLCLEHDLEYTEEILITRSLNNDGRGKIFFNDQPITQKLLKEIGNCLVEVHGQFDNTGLLNPATHLAVLDSYGGYKTLLREMADAFAQYKEIRQKREAVEQNIAQARLEEANLRHWLEEFTVIKPQENELETMEKQRLFLMNAEKTAQNLNNAYQALNGPTSSIRNALRQAQTAVARVNGLTDNKYAGIYEVLDVALINTQEAEEEIADALQEINLSQNEIDTIEQRLFALKDLARKHRVTVDELPQVWQDIETQLNSLSRGETDLSQLQQKEQTAYENYVKKAAAVHAERQATAQLLDRKIMAELPDLKMEKARFITQIISKAENNWNATGCDEVTFTVATNPNTPLGALNKIASGGELARFMLALKVNLAQTSQVDTMIFDEVDSGIGGATAQAVGSKLATLGENVQVLVVTHSPQVAAQSNQHYKVEKLTIDNTVTTQVKKLNNTEKKEEIARMLSGAEITDEARAAAEVLIGA